MAKYIFYTLSSLTCVTALLYATKTDNLTNCVTNVIKEWELNTFNRSYIEITIVNNDNQFEINAFNQLKDVQFITIGNSWQGKNVNSGVYVIVSKDFEELACLVAMLANDSYWKPSGKFIIIVQDIRQGSINHINDLLHEYNMFDIVLLVNTNNGYIIYSYKFIEHCVKNEVLHQLTRCTDENIRHLKPAMVGKRKIQIRDCHFRIIIENAWPYVLNPNKKINNKQEMNFYKKYSEAKIELVIDPDTVNDTFERNFISGTSESPAELLLREVKINKFEAAICGCMAARANTYNVSFSYPLLTDKQVYILPRARILPPWQAVTAHCVNIYVSFGFFILFCFMSTVLSIFPVRVKCVSRNILIVFGIALNKTCPKHISHRFPQRLIFTSLLFYGLIMPYVFQANLFSVISSPKRGYEPKSVDEIKGYNLLIYDKNIVDAHIKYKHCNSRVDCLRQVRDNTDQSVYTIMSNNFLEIFNYHLLGEDCNDNTYILKDTYRMLVPTVFFRRGSVLLDSYEKFLLRIGQSGILKRNLMLLKNKNRLKCQPVDKGNLFAFTLYELQTGFLVLLAGYTLSFIVFVCEFAIFKLIKKL